MGDIREKNKIICEWMQSVEDGLFLDGLYYFQSDYFSLEEVLFHSSWDWLMPVASTLWEKINEFEFESDEWLHFESELFNVDNTLSEFMNGELMAIYERCVDSIKYFNSL